MSRFRDVLTGESVCKGPQRHTLLFECDLQHQRQQDLQVHNREALRLAVDRGAQLDDRGAYHRLLKKVL